MKTLSKRSQTQKYAWRVPWTPDSKADKTICCWLEVWIVSSYLSGGMEASGVLVRLCFLGYTGVFSCENVSSCQLMVCMYIC